MQFIVAKQIAVEAETPEEAVAKSGDGKTISLTANPRPTPPQQVQRPAIPAAARAITGTPQATA